MWWGKRRLHRLGGALLAATLGAALVAAPADSSGPRMVRVASPGSVSGHATAIGPVPAAARMHITLALKVHHQAALTQFVAQVSDPSSPLYREYLTPQQFGQRFGASEAELRAVRASLRAHGLAAGPVPPNHLSIPVTASVGAIERALRIRIEHVALAHDRRATIASAPPALDSTIAPDVQAVIGLNGAAAPHPHVLRGALTRRLAVGERPHVQTGGPQACAAASSTASQDGAYTADQIASAYGFSGLYGAGDLGQGVTVAIFELEPNDPNDIAAYQSCYGTHTAVSYLPVDGGAGSGEGSGEAALDIEDVIGLAPQVNLLVYQGPNANQSVPNSGPYDVFQAIINQDRANVVSVSWGECEQLEGSSGAAAESTLFEQAAAEGQSIVAASGDSGSEDCNNANNVPNPSLAVDDPASQPFVTGVGGTSLTSAASPPAQATWNNGGNPTGLIGITAGAGGGGVSALWGMPGYQSAAASALHVANANSSRTACGASSGLCREVPDVASDADPNTGVVIYFNGSGSAVAQPSGWQAVGGTSAASPVWAALLALADASSACHGSPVGFANPALYKAASSAYSSDFYDVTTGNNDLTGTNGGLYPAGAGYDMATGLGTPNATPLAAALCQDTLRVHNPGTLRSVAGHAASYQVTTTGPVGGSLTFASSALPPGLSLNRSTGTITGRPSKLGTFTVAVAVVDSTLAVRGAVFTWVIQAAPTVTGASVRGLPSGRPRLALTISAGHGAPGLRKVRIALPPSLRFGAPHVEVSRPGAGPASYRARIVAGGLQITLAGAPEQVRLTVSYPALVTTARRHHGAFRLKLSVTDALNETSSLTASARSRG